MPQVARDVRTIMYSVEPNGHVAVHRFPWDANDTYSAEKFEKLKKRGFTFVDPRHRGGSGMPQVIVTNVVDLSKPILAGRVEEPVLEVVAEVESQNIKPEELVKPEEVPLTPAESLKAQRQERMAKARAAKSAKKVSR